jgi:hypothetical protein
MDFALAIVAGLVTTALWVGGARIWRHLRAAEARKVRVRVAPGNDPRVIIPVVRNESSKPLDNLRLTVVRRGTPKYYSCRSWK